MRAYEGSELALFAEALNWKRYWAITIAPFVLGEILEVGSGLGSNVAYLLPPAQSYLGLEPDDTMVIAARERHDDPAVSFEVGTLQTLAARQFDTILYLDVLEHIEDDRAELARTSAFLRPGGRVIVLSPAHPLLYSDFDRSIGHFRRYTRSSLLSITPRELTLSTVQFLDGVGAATGWANRFLLRQALPTVRQIALWDRFIVPVSRLTDVLTKRMFGRSIVAVWTTTPAPTIHRAGLDQRVSWSGE